MVKLDVGEKSLNFKISNVEHHISPREWKVDGILNTYGTSLDNMKKVIKDAVFVHRNLTQEFQIELAEQLKSVFEKHFQDMGMQLYGIGYSPTRRLTPDVEVGQKGRQKRIFIEIEFRPDGEYKDIIKFQIGYKKQTLELGILIAAMNKETMKVINRKYPPIYEKGIQTIEELCSDCPILVIGFDGQMISNEGIET